MVKIPILQHLECLRDEELEERREKRRRQLAEEEESKQNERRASGAEQSREQNLQVCWDVLPVFTMYDITSVFIVTVVLSSGLWTGDSEWCREHCRYLDIHHGFRFNVYYRGKRYRLRHSRGRLHQSVLWDEVVVCIVLGSHQIWEITIQSTVFLMATPEQLGIFFCDNEELLYLNVKVNICTV